MIVESFVIETEAEADDYLGDVLKHDEYRSMNEIEARAHSYIKDARIKDYFLSKAREMLKH